MPQFKEDLLAMLEKGYQAVTSFAESLDKQTRNKEGTAEAWAPKDELAHIGEWNIISALRIAASRRGQAPRENNDFEMRNVEIFKQYRQHTFESVLMVLDAGQRELVSQIEAMEEADLLNPDLYPWLNGRSLLKRIAGGSYFHEIWHLIPHYLRRGERETADRLADETIGYMLSLDDSQDWRAQQIYNQACYYALAGDKPEALVKLREAFNLSNAMTGWAKQDTDLITLWEEAEFQNLVNEYE